jgi:hypothetical protein
MNTSIDSTDARIVSVSHTAIADVCGTNSKLVKSVLK